MEGDQGAFKRLNDQDVSIQTAHARISGRQKLLSVHLSTAQQQHSNSTTTALWLHMRNLCNTSWQQHITHIRCYVKEQSKTLEMYKLQCKYHNRKPSEHPGKLPELTRQHSDSAALFVNYVVIFYSYLTLGKFIQTCIVWTLKTLKRSKTLHSISVTSQQKKLELGPVLKNEAVPLPHKTDKKCPRPILVSCLQRESRVSRSSFVPPSQHVAVTSLEPFWWFCCWLGKNELQLCSFFTEVRLRKRRSSISSRRLRCWRRTASTLTRARWAARSSATQLSQCAFWCKDFVLFFHCVWGELLMCQEKRICHPPPLQRQEVCVVLKKIRPCCVRHCGCLCVSGCLWQPGISGFYSFWIHCAARKQEGPFPQMVRALNTSYRRADLCLTDVTVLNEVHLKAMEYF